jgi:hypothetical protein
MILDDIINYGIYGIILTVIIEVESCSNLMSAIRVRIDPPWVKQR